LKIQPKKKKLGWEFGCYIFLYIPSVFGENCRRKRVVELYCHFWIKFISHFSLLNLQVVLAFDLFFFLLLF